MGGMAARDERERVVAALARVAEGDQGPLRAAYESTSATVSVYAFVSTSNVTGPIWRVPKLPSLAIRQT